MQKPENRQMKIVSRQPFPPSLWLHTAEAAPATATLTNSIEVDVAVVGAGYTGIRCALWLAEHGKRVAVLDANDVGWGASGRNVGQVNPLPPFNSAKQIQQLIGIDAGSRYTQAALDSADELFEIIRNYQIECDANQSGWVRVAHARSVAREFREQCRQWVDRGADIEMLAQKDLESLLGTTRFPMGALIRRGGNIQPLSYVRGLAKTAQSAGVAIYSGIRAESISRGDNGWTVKVQYASVKAKQVILATNGYADSLHRELQKSIVPVVSVQLATEPLPDSLNERILPSNHTFSDSRRVIFSGRKERDNRFLLAGHGFTESFDDHPDYERVKKEAVTIFPALKDIRWKFQWSGRIAVTENHLPHLHEPVPGLLMGLGYNGRGIAMSNVMGRVLAQKALGMPARELDIPTTDISPYPFHRFYKVGLPLAVAGMRLRDNFEIYLNR